MCNNLGDPIKGADGHQTNDEERRDETGVQQHPRHLINNERKGDQSRVGLASVLTE